MKSRNSFLIILCSVAAMLLLSRCANPVSPTGGLPDVSPPVLLKATPPLQSLNFHATKVKLTFDEYVEFKDLTKQLIISPPMEQNPDFRIRQKSIEIIFNDELKPSTTYNIFFGNAIVDITEGNPLSNFQYVFSTGNVLDSMSFQGKVKDAYSLEAVEGISVMLYLDNNDTISFDSLPYYIRPYFMSRTDEKGLFRFNNLPDKDFIIFALDDGNTNLLFDQKSERIAFASTLIHPYYIPEVPISDSMPGNDSLVSQPLVHNAPQPTPISMMLFQEVDSVQKLLKASLAQENHIIFVFKRPVAKVEFNVLDMDFESDWKIQEMNDSGDTISWWMKTIPSDSLEIVVSDNAEIIDTVQLALVKPSKKKKPREPHEKNTPLKIKFQTTLRFEEPLKLSFEYPILQFSPDSILLVEGQDSIFTKFVFDDSLPHQAILNYPWKEKTTYKLEIPDSLFTDLLGKSHDTISQTYTTPAIADFGNLLIHLKTKTTEQNYIFQLLQGERVIFKSYFDSDNDILVRHLIPGSYQLRLIYDANNNLRWDAGNYIHQIFPEKVLIYPSDITIRANWDIEEEWEL